MDQFLDFYKVVSFPSTEVLRSLTNRFKHILNYFSIFMRDRQTDMATSYFFKRLNFDPIIIKIYNFYRFYKNKINEYKLLINNLLDDWHYLWSYVFPPARLYSDLSTEQR